jgi:hypothetical protein
MLAQLALVVLGSAFLVVPLALALRRLVRRSPRPVDLWKRRYQVAGVVGVVLGAPIGLVVTFAAMASGLGLPREWNMLTLLLGSVAGALATAVLYMVPVALVHALVWLAKVRFVLDE